MANERFFERLARRKQAVAAAEVELEPKPPAEPLAEDLPPVVADETAIPPVPSTEASEPKTQEQWLRELDLPDPETLGVGSDFRPFMDARVPQFLRSKAMKQLFRQPKFNFRDGLDDYDDDYAVWEPLGDRVTCDMKYMEEVKARRRAEEEAANQSQQDESEICHDDNQDIQSESASECDDDGDGALPSGEPVPDSDSRFDARPCPGGTPAADARADADGAATERSGAAPGGERGGD